MKRIVLIRHAESSANADAGTKTNNYADIPLSPKGKKQTVDLVGHIEQIKIKPGKIIISNYLRTLETAKPFIETNNLENLLEEWTCVREFTYLNTEKYNGTTVEERKEAVIDYMNNKDIYHHDGGEAESFKDFIKRIEETICNIKSLETSEVIIFSHGFFIFIFKKYVEILKGKESLDDKDITILKLELANAKNDNKEFPILNTSIHEIFI